MAYITNEDGITYDGLLVGATENVLTKMLTITAGTALKRGSIVTSAGALVTATDTAYGIVKDTITATDTKLVIYIKGLFNRNKLIVGTGDTVEAHEDQLRDGGIYLSTDHI